MQATTTRPRIPGHVATRFGDSVFRSQVLLAGAVAFVVCMTVALSGDGMDDSPAFFLGLTTVLWITIAAALVPWLRFPVRWQMIVPMLDIAGIGLLRLAEPESGFGILLIFPVIWLATSFGRIGCIAGPALASTMLISQSVIGPLDVLGAQRTTTPISAASLSVALSFVSAVVYTTGRRVESQRVLLRRQTQMLEKALGRARIQEATVREALDAVQFAVITVDSRGETLTANRAAWAMLAELGLPSGTPLHRFPLYRSDKVTPLPAAEFPHLRVLAGEPVDSETYWIGHRTGTRFTIDVTARLLFDSQGKVDGAVIVLRDVSTEVRAIADRDDLVTSMSHELRTPLSSILGYVDLALETDDLPVDTRDMLEIALASTQRMNSLVSDLLAARSTSPDNTISLSPAPCDISALVRESVDAIRPVAGDRLIAISLDIEPDVHAVADGFRLRQVVDNLLSNAIKYNRIGGRITVAVSASDGSSGGPGPAADIRITDTGRGMTAEEQKGLFERFYRAESVRGSTVHGTGLGLNISREIVLLHRGTIDVASEPGHGTEVTVRIPCGDPQPLPPDADPARSTETS